MKPKAPPPPPAPQPAPRRIFRNAVPDGGGSPEGDTKENIMRTMVDLHITLPSGYQTTVTVDGRQGSCFCTIKQRNSVESKYTLP